MNQTIRYMKSLNIKFANLKEADAQDIMRCEFSGTHLLSYAPLFDRYRSSEKAGQFVDLDFAYLYDLALIDTQLMKLVVCMCLDIERTIKAILLSDCEQIGSPGNLVEDFVSDNEPFFSEVYNLQNISFAVRHAIADKKVADLDLDTFLEIIHYGTLERFVRYFYSQYAPMLYGETHAPFEKHLIPIRRVRNPSAHNNGIISQLCLPNSEPFEKNNQLLSFLGRHGISHRTLDTNMSKPVIHDLCNLLYMYAYYVRKDSTDNLLHKFQGFLENRCTQNATYFHKNPALISAYRFLLDVIKILNFS